MSSTEKKTGTVPKIEKQDVPKIEKLENVSVAMEKFEYLGVVYRRDGIYFCNGGAIPDVLDSLCILDVLTADAGTYFWVNWAGGEPEKYDEHDGIIEMTFDVVQGSHPSIIPSSVLHCAGDMRPIETVLLGTNGEVA